MSETVRGPLTKALLLLARASARAEDTGRAADCAQYLSAVGRITRYLEWLAEGRADSALLWSVSDSVERLADSAARWDREELDLLDRASDELMRAAAAAERGGL